ncbi:uncharacterized protein SCHCODRAFT_02534964 [Schizophyllum commune H4-8]|uniref:uncharacterized protein n=1 Tax=Schizophyllum commune (strain H4-8 / FGSC 9210) TaxID=578458 RepID=UPI00215FDC32|nr:uncharacterized protein SCHCODRAFT_02534964 [Schizophyllum commune H4-8]KAI5894766.1 hypothetical protein SCHCODRAFT_02534964 [Schizophyllum commune H4-8]
MDTSMQPNAADLELVDVYVRGGYPVDRDVMFSFASGIAEHYRKAKPIDCEDCGGIYNRVNEVLGRYEDLRCTTIDNPADPNGSTWIVATTPVKRVQVRWCDLDSLRRDPWRPPSAFDIQESESDIDVKQYLAQNGVPTQPFHTTFWNVRTY